MAQLSVRFLGLAGLVAPRTPGDPWLSVLPNLRNGSRAGDHGVPYDIPPHQALVVVRSRDLQETQNGKSPKLRATRAAGSSNQMLPDGEELVFFEPDREAISLEGPPVPGLQVENQAPADYGKNAAKAGEERSLCWVPPLSQISKYSMFDRSPLVPDSQGRSVVPGPNGGRLAGTFVLDRGRLGASGVIMAAAQKPALYEFRLPGQVAGAGGWKQSLATGYELQVTQVQPTFVLLFEDRAGDIRRLELVGEDVQMWVINRELEETLGFTYLHEATGPPTGDQDFAYFFSLAEGWDATQNAAVPIPYVRTEGGGGWNKPCNSPQFAG
jgi:hypothetical protein